MNFAANFPTPSLSSTKKADGQSTNSPAPQRGWALVSVLWTLAILSMMAAATEALMVTSARIEHRAYDQARIEADINAGAVRALLGIEDPRMSRRWRVDGVAQAFTFDRLAMTISVQDEAGLIDLNNADAATLAGLFTTAGLAPATAQTLTANILDWREPVGGDDPDRQQGKTDGQYGAAGLPYRPRHNTFQTVDEMKLVLGMSPALFARVAPALTVYSRDASVDQSLAPPVVLSALYPGDANKVAQVIQARTNPPPSNDPNTLPPGPPGVIAQSETSLGHSYLVTIAAAPNGRHVVRSAVVEPTGDANRPYLVEAWR